MGVAASSAWLGVQRWGLRRLESLVPRRRRIAPHLATGSKGEREALLHLREVGYVVVARRWKSVRLRGDVDLIAWDGERLCFVEVKARGKRDPMEPADAAVDSSKQEMLRKMARAYLKGFARELRDGVLVRFDVVSVYLVADNVEFEVRKGAFGWE
jgi:putative endonuclease